ncbi:MAG TPA: stage II sporulation protein M [Candidatus Acidoferrales bacterium]|nr:stage II sporulation protein M [Candidatus Acidoferrales bacterium]
MIIDLRRFVTAERAYWDELQNVLARLESEPGRRLPLAEIQRLHYLYERCSADLARLDTFATEPGLRAMLQSLVGRAYSEIHETRAPLRIRWRSLIFAFPRAFRRHLGGFGLSLGVTLLGCAFGWFAIRTDPASKAVLMPFGGLMGSPAERVHEEESNARARADRLRGKKATFSAELMTNNIQVTMLTLAAGITWGAGTLILLFYNGVILGAVAADYMAAGQAVFLAGWLLPHGSIEIPAILLGGQCGFILAGAMIGWGGQTTRADRLRAVATDLFSIAAGAAALLIWAGVLEAFVSQYHQPVIPYALKISVGVCELAALGLFLGWAGRE